MTVAGKAFSVVLWNRGLGRYIRLEIKKDHPHPYEPQGIEPNPSGQCVLLVYMKGHIATWKTVSCEFKYTSLSICKSERNSTMSRETHIDSSTICCEQCLAISHACFLSQFKDFRLNSSAHPAINVDIKYVTQLIKALSVHDTGKKYLFRGKNYSNYSKETNVRNSVFGFKYVNRINMDRPLHYVEIMLDRKPLHSPNCGSNMMKCSDGTCASLYTLCTSNFICSVASCACTMNGRSSGDPKYCRLECQPGNCACPALMFQCSSKGCIPYFFVCDGHPHCEDSSDEFCGDKSIHEKTKPRKTIDLQQNSNIAMVIGSPKCMGFKCKNDLCLNHQFVDDLIPDCLEGEDEEHGSMIKYKGFIYGCLDNQQIRCVPDHSQCFKVHQMCLYDHDEFGRIAHCRDASHLFNCEWIECTNTVKCPSSYCIPIRKVCNGIKDCINGEDELDCKNNICPGHLKCSGTQFCIHPREVCDGIPHCPNSDDEMMCDVKECPEGCQCGGYSAVCRGDNLLYTPIFLTAKMRYISLGHKYMINPDFSNLTFITELLILDLAGSGISGICGSFQYVFPFYDSLFALYLQDNVITYLASGCFHHLSSLSVLELHGNPLKQISDGAFQKLYLQVLVIRNTSLSVLSDNIFGGMRRLRLFDMEGIHLEYADKGLSEALISADGIYADDTRLCCIVHNVKNCQNGNKISTPCLRILFEYFVSPVLTLLGISIIMFNGISVWVNYKSIMNKKPVQYILNCIILGGGILCGCYILIISLADSYYGERYVINSMLWENNFLCRTLFVLVYTGPCFIIISTTMFQHIAYLAITKIAFNVDDINDFVYKTLLFSISAVMANSILWAVLQDDLNHLCSVVDTKWSNFVSVFSIIPLIFIMITSFLHSTYIHVCMYKCVYGMTQAIKIKMSSDSIQHNHRLLGMLKTLFQAIAFRALECLPIPCVVLLTVCGMDIRPEINLVALLVSISVASVWNTGRYIWNPFSNLKRNNRTINTGCHKN